MLNKKINDLKEKFVNESIIVENMVEKSIRGLVEKKEDLLKEVLEKDEPIVNKMEIEIERMCTTLIARYQPEAGNLRSILMILKMNNDLERIGDLAVNISESALYLIEKPMVKPLIDIPRMSKEATGMLRNAINAFINNDIKLAKEVLKRDEIVDGLRDQILRELITFMTADPNTIERSIHLIRISRALERVADLSTNICEDIVFMIEGEIIKHSKKDNE